MIGKPEWFVRRKYLGWGVFPVKWQGWLYLALILLPLIIFQSLPFWNNETRVIVTTVWALFLIIDITDIMIRMKKDEREKVHEAIAERNALWVVLLVLLAGVAYQAISSALKQSVYVDPLIIAALVAGLIAKAISNIYLDRRD